MTALDWAIAIAIMVGKSLLVISALLIYIAYALLADRKIWAAVQLRKGPNVVGAFGLLQSFADLLKFALKEPMIPSGANKGVFLLAPVVTAKPGKPSVKVERVAAMKEAA